MKLLQPAPYVRDPERRRQSSLLTSLILVMIVSIDVTVTAWVALTGSLVSTNAEVPLVVLATLGLLVAFALGRAGRYELGAALAIAIMAGGLFVAAIPNLRQSELRLLMWMVIPVLLSSVFLSIRATIGIAVVLAAGILVYPNFVPGVALEDVAPGPVGFVVLASALIVVMTHHRNQLEVVRQAQLSTQERLLNALTEGMMDVITQVDFQGAIVYQSPSLQQLTGYDPTAFVGKPFPTHLIHPDDQAEILAQGARALQTLESVRYEYRFRHADGHYLWLETIGHFSGDKDKTPNLILVTRDVSERKRAQEQLNQQKELLQTIFDHIPVMIALYDGDLNFKLFNREYTRVLGWTLEQAAGADIMARHYPDPEIRERVRETMLTAPPGWRDSKSITTGGEVIETTWANVLLSDGTGLAIGQDIRERKRVEVALREAHDDLERQVAARTAELSRSNAQLYEEIHQREQAERRVIEEHALIRTLFDILPDHIYVKDLQSRFVLGNASIAKSMNAATPEDLFGKTDFDFWERELVVDYYADEQRVMATGEALVNKEEPATAPDGFVRWFLSTKVPLRDSAGQITGLVGVSRDITERREAEAALRRMNEELEQRVEQRTSELSSANSRLEAENRERLQAETTLKELAAALEQQARTMDEVLSATPELFAMYDREGRYLYLNAPSLAAFGLTAQTAYHKTWRELNLPESLGVQLEARLERVFATGEADVAEQQLALPGREPRDFESILSPIHDLSGKVVAAVMTSRDVTERKRAESALRVSEERYRIISELISDYAYSFLVAEDGTITADWTTESFARVTGYTVDDDDINSGRLKLYHPDDSALADRHVRRVLAGESVTGEYRIIRRDGQMRWLRITRMPAFDPDNGRVIRYYGVATDVTEEKLAEREKLALALERERLSLMNRFVLAVSHDFRTSLANIETSRYLITRILQGVLLERVQTKLDTIHECVDHLTEQLENFSTVSFLADPNLHPCGVNDLVAFLAHEFTRSAGDRNLTLTSSLDPELPLVLADEDELKRAIRHMVTNALNYTMSGGSVTLRTYADNGNVAIEVRDTGLGIEPDHLAHIFDLFYRADPARAVHSGGVGLGLSIVKMVAEAHSGRVMVDSTAGKGSIFTLVLPAVEADVTAPHA